MEIEYLKEFIAIAQNGSFSAAATATRVSQPSVSKHIKQIKNEVGAELVKRDSPSPTLTPAGEAFLPAAHAIVATWDQGCARAKELAGKDYELVTVQLYEEYRPEADLMISAQEEGEIKDNLIKLKTMGLDAGSSLFENLKEGRSDILISVMPPEGCDPLLECKTIGEEAVVAVVGSNNPLSKRDSVEGSGLVGQKLKAPINGSQGDGYARGDFYRAALKALGDAGLSLKVENSSWEGPRGHFRKLEPTQNEYTLAYESEIENVMPITDQKKLAALHIKGIDAKVEVCIFRRKAEERRSVEIAYETILACARKSLSLKRAEKPKSREAN